MTRLRFKQKTSADTGYKMRLASSERKHIGQTNGPLDRRTDGRPYRRTDKPSYRDTKTHLKNAVPMSFRVSEQVSDRMSAAKHAS